MITRKSSRSSMKKLWKWIALGVLGVSLTLLPPIVQTTLAASSTDRIIQLSPNSQIDPRTAAQNTDSALDAGRALYTEGRFAEAIAEWQRAIATYTSSGDTLHQALGFSYLSLAYQATNQWDAAQEAIDHSVELLNQANQSISPILWAQVLNTKASLLLHTGHPETALETWEQAQNYYEQADDSSGALGSQINQAQALQSLGFYRRARQLLEDINQQLATMPDSELKVSGLRSLGTALQVIGDLQASYDALKQSLDIAKQIGATQELSSNLVNIGRLAADLDDPETAIAYFEAAEQTAVNPIDRVQAQLSHLRLAVQQGQWQQAATLVSPIRQQLTTLPPSRDSIYATINFAHTLGDAGSSHAYLSSRDVGQLLATAIQSARQLQDPRAESHALRQLGQIYMQTQQWADATDLTQQSLAIANSIQADDIIAQSAAQLGRLLKQQGKSQDAIAAYGEAVTALKALRGDLAAINPDVQFSFRESVEPTYRELVELLLDGTPSQESLIQARALIENLQLAELDNFLRQACLDTQSEQIDQVDRNATVVYPIILPDRLAVILSQSGQPLRHYTTTIPKADVETTLHNLLAALHPSSDDAERLRYSQQVYNWLIRPAEQDHALTETKTLVFVLDGLLRNIPMSALHDGEHYLIEKYAVALSPGLNLLSTKPLTQQHIHAIVGGISEARNNFSALPAVTSEVNDIAQLLSAPTLLNQDFTSSAIAERLKTNSTNVVHLATHGQFSSNQAETFLLTWNGQINIWELAELLQNRESDQAEAIELLVLSACDTAAGDDRAALGLAGLAVKSGARSTLATLWPIKDQAASQLMIKFYRELEIPGITKAEALRTAQLSLLANPSYQDPFFWSAYVLVGNWL
jgi:CHAT domain-containing protein